MKVELVLIVAFAVTAAISKAVTGNWNLVFSGNLGMFIMLCITATGHFIFTRGMAMMMPDFIPLKTELVYGTGIVEVLLGLALLFPQTRYVAGIALIVLFVLMLPANINGALKHIDMEKATYTGRGPGYLWFRIPLQLFFIAWVGYFSVRN